MVCGVSVSTGVERTALPSKAYTIGLSPPLQSILQSESPLFRKLALIQRCSRTPPPNRGRARPLPQTELGGGFPTGSGMSRATAEHLPDRPLDHPAPDRFSLTQPCGVAHSSPMADQRVRRPWGRLPRRPPDPSLSPRSRARIHTPHEQPSPTSLRRSDCNPFLAGLLRPRQVAYRKLSRKPTPFRGGMKACGLDGSANCG